MEKRKIPTEMVIESEEKGRISVHSKKEYDNITAISANRHKIQARKILDDINGSFILCGIQRKGDEMEIHNLAAIAGSPDETLELVKALSELNKKVTLNAMENTIENIKETLEEETEKDGRD